MKHSIDLAQAAFSVHHRKFGLRWRSSPSHVFGITLRKLLGPVIPSAPQSSNVITVSVFVGTNFSFALYTRTRIYATRIPVAVWFAHVHETRTSTNPSFPS
jgi:hypothetical protein